MFRIASGRFPQYSSKRVPRAAPQMLTQGSTELHQGSPNIPTWSPQISLNVPLTVPHSFPKVPPISPQGYHKAPSQGSHTVLPSFPRFPTYSLMVPARLRQGSPKCEKNTKKVSKVIIRHENGSQSPENTEENLMNEVN